MLRPHKRPSGLSVSKVQTRNISDLGVLAVECFFRYRVSNLERGPFDAAPSRKSRSAIGLGGGFHSTNIMAVLDYGVSSLEVPQRHLCGQEGSH